MKNDKITAQQSTNQNPKYCPYCGRHMVSVTRDQAFCHSCGSAFTVTRIEQTTKGEVREPIRLERPYSKDIIVSPAPSHTVDASQKVLRYELSGFEKTLNTLGLQDDARQAARRIYIRASTSKIGNDRISNEALASASVYAACRQNKLSNSLEEIASAFHADKTEAERAYSILLNEIGFLAQTYTTLDENSLKMYSTSADKQTNLDISSFERRDALRQDATRFLEKKGTFEFLRLWKERPKRWKTLEKELAVSPRTLSERITQALELGYVEKVRRLKIGATYYRLTKKGNEIFETMEENTSIY
jgi:DNA-binding HxlR family transcriptional regulator